jgi:hypothetical protein
VKLAPRVAFTTVSRRTNQCTKFAIRADHRQNAVDTVAFAISESTFHHSGPYCHR